GWGGGCGSPRTGGCWPPRSTWPASPSSACTPDQAGGHSCQHREQTKDQFKTCSQWRRGPHVGPEPPNGQNTPPAPPPQGTSVLGTLGYRGGRAGQARLDQLELAGGVALVLEVVAQLDLDRRAGHAPGGQVLDQAVGHQPDRLGGVGGGAQGGPDVQAVAVVDPLVLGQPGGAGQGGAQGQRVDRGRAAGGRRQVEDVVVAALDGGQQRERAAAGAALAGHGDH